MALSSTEKTLVTGTFSGKILLFDMGSGVFELLIFLTGDQHERLAGKEPGGSMDGGKMLVRGTEIGLASPHKGRGEGIVDDAGTDADAGEFHGNGRSQIGVHIGHHHRGDGVVDNGSSQGGHGAHVLSDHYDLLRIDAIDTSQKIHGSEDIVSFVDTETSGTVFA